MKRDTSIDFIKSIAIIFVIMIHVSGPAFSVYSNEATQWNILLLISSGIRCAVPLFLMCSGVLMLNPEKNITLKKLFSKNIIRLIVAMVFWAMLYKIFHLADTSSLCASRIFHAFKEVLMFNQEYHFYYIQIMLIVYAFLPVTSLFIKNADKTLLRYFLILWLVLSSLLPLAVNFYPLKNLSGITSQWIINITYGAIGYSILGFYLRNNIPSVITGIILTITGYIIIFAGTYFASLETGYLNEMFFGGNCIGNILLSSGVFTLILRIKEKKIISKITAEISKASFGIYLVHVLFIEILSKHNISIISSSPVISLFIITPAVFAASYVTYKILSYIPVINKWII